MFSFHDLEMKFGEVLAYQHLLDIEKITGLSAQGVAGLDLETRLANALRAQDAMTEASKAA